MTLVLALFVIVLLTLLIVGLLMKSQTTNKGSELHVEALRAQQMGESALGLVLSRIQEATRTPSGQAWASQPGAIRVNDDHGVLVAIHKLYSAADASTAVAGDLASDLPPADWQDKRNLFVDLNAPYSKGGALSFPIVDPRLYSGTGANDPEGFSYRETTLDGKAITGTVLPGAGEDKQRLPMPVKWLYVLSNGEFVAPVEQPDGTVRVAATTGPAEVIGRIAFWTDDETSKVNINTAAGGAFWDTPRTVSTFEQGLASSQPVQGEFQRYPGHPATTDLRAVFPWIPDSSTLYDFVPKIRGGGSNGGTVQTTATTKPLPITPDTDRLYAATGEAKYKPDRTEFSASPAFGEAFATRVQRGDFLLTATSRAPELNLFGRPRLAIWPIDKAPANRSPLDKLIAMCATIREAGTTPLAYYFQREDSTSATHDYEEIARNKELMKYLRTATGKAVPGFGGDFATKYTGPVRDQILTEIFDYVRGATNLKDPLGRKYADPILAKHLEPGEGQVAPIRIADWGTKGFGRFITVGEAFFWFTWQGQGQGIVSPPAVPPPMDKAVSPSFPLPAVDPAPGEVQLQAVFVLNFVGQAVGYSEFGPDMTVKIEGLDQFALNGVNMGFPASGTVRVNPVGDVPLSNIEDFRGMLRYPDSGNPSVSYGKKFKRDGAADAFPFYSNIINVPAGVPCVMTGGTNPVRISIYTGNGATEANRVQTIEMDVPQASFLPPAKLSGDPAVSTSDIARYRLWGTGDARDRFSQSTVGGTRQTYMMNQDVTRSLVSRSGDHRLTAAFREVPASFFMPHQGANGTTPGAWTSTVPKVDSLLNALSRQNFTTSSPMSTGTLNSAVNTSSPSLSAYARPYVATHIKGKPSGTVAWDFDTGIADRADGAHINKPDEGSLGRAAGNKPGYFGGSEFGLDALDITMFLPNRQISSPGMFGSLPTGIDPANPAGSKSWQTLQLRPDPVAHPGNAAPRDSLLLDLFWMPVVEPYAISEPFSTAGKINMNSRLVPFTQITRETALYAAMRNERLLVMDPAKANEYKIYNATASTERPLLNVAETMRGFRARFDAGGIFMSPTEISGLYLIPNGTTLNNMPDFWETNSYTGDNVREKPYANLLAKLTTKSNSYSVHVVAQALKKGSGSAASAAVYGLKADRVTAEWKGTFVVERFLDPNDPQLPDFAGEASLADWTNAKYNGDSYYQTRVLQVREWR